MQSQSTFYRKIRLTESDGIHLSPLQRLQAWADRLATERPDVPYMAPFMMFLLLLTLNDALPYPLRPVAIAIRGILPAFAFYLFRRHYPPLGKPHWIIAIIVGVAVAIGWVVGQHFFNNIHVGSRSLGGRLFLFPGQPHPSDPRLGPDIEHQIPISPISWWLQAVLRIVVSATTVPIVEEIFWRAFLLRAFIDWDRFNRIPLGQFSWLAFLGTSLISIFEHPDNWGVSILCWIVYNGLMYWKKSVTCLILTHGITNLVLYTWVVWGGTHSHYPDYYWLFW